MNPVLPPWQHRKNQQQGPKFEFNKAFKPKQSSGGHNDHKSSLRSKISNDVEVSRSSKNSSTTRPGSRIRSKTAEGTDLRGPRTPPPKRPATAYKPLDPWLLQVNKGQSEICLSKKTTEAEEGEEEQSKVNKKNEKRKASSRSLEIRKVGLEGPKRTLVYDKPSETYSKLFRESGLSSNGKSVRLKVDLEGRRPSEIPKPKWICQRAITATTSASQDRAHAKELELKQSDAKSKSKKDEKAEDKIKQALNENFSTLVPLYESELKRITDTWVNTIYCSLTMRTNLVKLLYQAIPSINRSQFHMEDETLLHCIARAKSYTRSEAENLIQFIKLLIANRNKAKDDYVTMMTNNEIAESYNNNWKALTKKIVDIGEETKQLQMDIPELQKKKESYEAMASEKIRKMESNLNKKDEEVKKLANQLSILQQRESSYKGNVSLKIEDYKDIKEEVLMLKSVEKEYADLKTKYVCQNDIFEKKIHDLENLLEERKRTLKKERDLKKQLQSFLVQLHSHQRQMYRTIGKEQVDFIMGKVNQGRNKRREQLWILAIKLVLKGFLVQMRKLERDRNKILLELNSNDLENYNALANAIVQKDNFIKSIRQQMHAFHIASKYSTTKNSENSFAGCVRN